MMRSALSLALTLFGAGLSIPLAAQDRLVADSTIAGQTAFLISDVETKDFVSIEHFSLVALNPEWGVTDVLNLEELVPDAKLSSEFDLVMAPEVPRLMVNLFNSRGVRQLWESRLNERGRFDPPQLVTAHENEDPREIYSPSFSRDGSTMAWFTRVFTKGKPQEAKPDRSDYELWLRLKDGRERRLSGVLPAMDFSPDGEQIAYLKLFPDPTEEHAHFRFPFCAIMVEPVAGGEPRLVQYGWLLVDLGRPALVWSADGESIYVAGESLTLPPGEGQEVKPSLRIFYEATRIYPALFRVPVNGVDKAEKLYEHKPVLWMRPSPDRRYLYTFSYQTRAHNEAWLFDTRTGEKLPYLEGENKGEPFKPIQPVWTFRPDRFLPIWKDGKTLLRASMNGWVSQQQAGHAAQRLSAERQQLITSILGSSDAARRKIHD